MKKIVCMTLVLSAFVSALVSCGSSDSSETEKNNTTEAVVETTAAPTTKAESSDNDGDSDPDAEPETTQQPTTTEAVTEPVTEAETEPIQQGEFDGFAPINSGYSNKGLDSPEAVVNAYLDAFLNHSPEEVYSLFYIDELTAVNSYAENDEEYGPTWRIHGQQTFLDLLDEEMTELDTEIEEYTSIAGEPWVSVSLADDITESVLESYTSEGIDIPITEAYLYDAYIKYGDDGRYFSSCIEDDVAVFCINGRWYMTSLIVLYYLGA